MLENCMSDLVLRKRAEVENYCSTRASSGTSTISACWKANIVKNATKTRGEIMHRARGILAMSDRALSRIGTISLLKEDLW